MYTFGLWKTIPDSAVYWDNFSRNSFNIVEVHRIVVYSLALRDGKHKLPFMRFFDTITNIVL